MSFAKLKRRKTDFEALQKKFETKDSKKSYDDARFFYPVRDDQGNGVAELRFLPTNDNKSDVPFAKYYLHSFKGPGGWCWQKCRTSIGESDCPICEANKELIEPYGKWDSTPNNVKLAVRERKRKLVLVANVYIVKDKATPENEGKVFLFKFGKVIMDKIKESINPEFEDEKQFDPFDPWHGANFIFKIRKVDGQTNYDKSTWGDIGPVLDDDDKIEELSKKLYDLSEFDGEASFTSYEEQLKIFEKSQRVRGSKRVESAKDPVADVESDEPKSGGKIEKQASTAATTESDDLEKLFSGSDEVEEDDIPY